MSTVPVKSSAVATVWVDADMRADPAALAHRAACQAYVERLARDAGLEVKRELADGRAYLGASGTPEAVGNFLGVLARAGIGGLLVELEGGDESAFRLAAEASRELEFEVVVRGG